MVLQVVNPPSDVPKPLENYVPWFEQSIEAHGFHMGAAPGPKALHLQFAYADTPQELKISVFLMQNDVILMRAVASNNGDPQHASDQEALLTHLVDTALKAFDAQLSEFAPQLLVQGDKTTTPGTAGHASAVTAMSFGTAFATNSPNTYVTARHVIAGGTEISLYCGPDKTAPAEVLEVDSNNDLAVLRSTLKAPAFLELAPDDSVSLGDHVFTMGFPTPDILGVAPKYTDGAISSLSGMGDSRSLMQISVPIQPGNSGGPLVDAKGRVVGVIDSTAAVQNFFRDTGGALPQNVNFAVASYYLYPLVKGIPRASSAAFVALPPVKRVAASLCLVVVKEGG